MIIGSHVTICAMVTGSWGEFWASVFGDWLGDKLLWKLVREWPSNFHLCIVHCLNNLNLLFCTEGISVSVVNLLWQFIFFPLYNWLRFSFSCFFLKFFFKFDTCCNPYFKITYVWFSKMIYNYLNFLWTFECFFMYNLVYLYFSF